MIKAISYKKSGLSILFATMTVFALSLPSICSAMDVDVSPNIINIESNRLGEIRIFTDMRYSTYTSGGDSIFVYFNEGESVENIRATRDSLGNLIVKFDLEDLLDIGEDYLYVDADNDVLVVVVMDNGDEYSGESDVYITDKKAP